MQSIIPRMRAIYVFFWRPGARHRRLLIISLVFFTFLIVELLPVSGDNQINLESQIRDQANITAAPVGSRISIAASYLYEAHAKIFPKDADGKPSITGFTLDFRWDNFIVLVATYLMIMIVVGSREIERAMLLREEALSSPQDGVNKDHANLLVFDRDDEITILRATAEDARSKASDLYRRSTLLLAGGIIMSFLAVLVFYLAAPILDDRTDDVLSSSYIAQAVRAVGMLIFLEAIAWFLLRQHRIVLEDFKSFHRLSVRRSNLIAAARMLTHPEQRLMLVMSLLAEDLSGRLSKEETTEAIEAAKQVDANPIFSLLHKALDRLGPLEKP